MNDNDPSGIHMPRDWASDFWAVEQDFFTPDPEPRLSWWRRALQWLRGM